MFCFLNIISDTYLYLITFKGSAVFYVAKTEGARMEVKYWK